MNLRTVSGLIVAGLVAPLAGCNLPNEKTKATTDSPTATNKPKAAGEPANVAVAPPPKIHASTYFAAGQLHEREGNYLAAAEQYTKAIDADMKYVAAYNRLGIVYDRLGMYDKAEDNFIRAIDFAPASSYLRNNLGFSFMLHSDYSKAERALREAIQLKPDYQRARMNLGVVMVRTGRVDEAVEIFALAIPRDAAFYNVGLLCIADKRFELARQAFHNALALNPQSREAQTQLDRLQFALRSKDDPRTATLVKDTRTLLQKLAVPTPAPAGKPVATLPRGPQTQQQAGRPEADFPEQP